MKPYYCPTVPLKRVHAGFEIKNLSVICISQIHSMYKNILICWIVARLGWHRQTKPGGGGGGGHLGIKGWAYARYQNLKIPLKHWFWAKKAPFFH